MKRPTIVLDAWPHADAAPDHMQYLVDRHPRLRRAIRRAAELRPHDGTPIIVVDGNTRPAVKGSFWAVCTRTGRKIEYPGAYRAAGGTPVYVPSTRVVTVGTAWLTAALDATAGNMDTLAARV